MEWQTPKVGQHRERLTFAWFPIECEDGITRWLCKVRVLEEYQPNYDHYSPVCAWTVVKAYRAEVEIRKRSIA